MKRQNRLTKNEDFKAILDRHQSFSNQSFVLSYVKNEVGYSRIGITISGKYGNAVERNKGKRQTRMLVNRIFDLTQPVDCVIIIKKGFGNKTYEENLSEMTYLYQKMQKHRGVNK